MMAGAGGAMRATGWRATAIRFQQFGEPSAACSLSDISGWRAGVLYPLAGGGRESGAAHLDLLGSPGWCSGCWPHDGEVAGGADSFFVISGSGPTMELGAIGATDAAAAVELPGHRRQHPGSTTALSGQR
jgi:hypothetical protein